MGYTKNTLSGFSWHTFLKVVITFLTLFKIAVLARLLTPTDFGLFALVMIALGLTEAATQTGINITILQSEKKIDYFLDTAWVIAIVRGFLISFIMILMGLGMSRFYQEPILIYLVPFAALVPIIKGFINPSIVLLQKELRFFHDSLYRFSLTAVEISAAVLLAWYYTSVMALIAALIVAAIFEVIMSFVIFSTRPAFRYLHQRARLIFENAKSLNLTAVLTYLNENIDDFILGRILGTFRLGLYHNAYALGHKPNYMIASATVHSTLPVYIKIAQEPGRLRRAFLRATGVTMGLAILATLPLFVAPDLIVRTLLGEQWLAIIPAVPWLALAGIVQSFSFCLYSLFLATKNYRPMNLHLLLSVIVLVICLLIFGPIWGVTGAGIAVLTSRVLTLPVAVLGVRRFFQQHQPLPTT
jgi:lipopolysaccharide exporter